MKNRVLQLLIDKDSQPTYVGWPSEASETLPTYVGWLSEAVEMLPTYVGWLSEAADLLPTCVGWPSEAFAYFLQLTADASTGRQAL